MLESLEGSAFSVWLRESPSIWAYPTVLTLHTLGMGVLAGASAAFDLRLLGIARPIPLNALRILFPVMWSGFWVNALTGSMLFAANATTRATSALFILKLCFVALGVATIVLLKRHVYDAPPGARSVSPRAGLLAVASLLMWLAAITAGRLLAYLT